ncbi:PIN domain-containing protein [Acinetobacter pittii]|uniref:PIN domain-containing protein n=1 Tax=Acinetobacter pittii TaxID=48296 RepID=UPI001EFEE002|nr:PIN domain-containing protein [Acinetobacter pittii]MCG9510975.1 PIN domain-containing protein [Acinetobacter pittii]
MKEMELDFGAITIDNATFKSEGYKFYEGLLGQMKQFKDSPVQVLQTDIVHNEAIKHIGQEISKTRSAIDQALRSANKQLKINEATITKAKTLLSLNGSEHEIAESRLHEYYEFIGAIKLNSEDYVDLSILMRMYFSNEAPFETGKDKKNEFPDAIALLTLDEWAESNDINVVAVSQDKGWKDYSEHSKRITLVASLAEALEKFQPHNKVASIVSHIRNDSLLDEDNHVLEMIQQALIDSVDGYDINIEVDSHMHVDWDDTSASYVSHEFDKEENGSIKISVVRINDQCIVLKLGAEIEVEVEANFYFSIRDSIDKDYVSLGGNVCTTIEKYHTDILLTLSGDFSKDFDNIRIGEIEVLETLSEADFGYIEPDWRNEYE